METRSLMEPIEVRADDGKVTAVGTAIRYGALSKNLGGWIERIMPGAATKALENRDIVAYHEHLDRTKLLGTVAARTLRLFDSPTELRYEIDLPDTTAGRDAAALLERGDLAGASYGFKPKPSGERWTPAKDGLALRTLEEFDFFDHVALTCRPAYDSSTSELALRSLADATGCELRSLIDAARNRELAKLIDPETRENPDDSEHPDDLVVPRSHIVGLYA